MASGVLDLVARDVSVRFEGLKALSGVTLAVPRGRITGLIGPNGAGKTTLINALTGFQRVDAGTVELEGETVTDIAAHKLRRKGVARTFQSGRLFRDLPVVDNLEVTGVGLGQTRRDAIAGAERVMDWLGISHLAGAICRNAALHRRAAGRHRARLYGHAAGRSHSSACRCRGGRPMTLLAVDDITVRYGRLTALRGITLKIAEGEVLFVTGPNGAGKSTLLNAIAGVVPPVSGAITLDGAEVTGAPPEQIARRGFSLVPEGRNVFGALSIEENLKVGAGMRTDRQKVPDDIESVYREFPMLAERRHAPAGMLSGGQQQMLVIGRALMTSPRLMAIDEPSLGLAPKIIDQVYEILERLRAQRKLTLLIVEQSSTRAMMTGGRMILMRGGRIVLEGEAGDMVKDERLRQAYFGFGDH